MKNEKILVFLNIKQYYVISSENRKNITVFEMINAADQYSFSLIMIIQNHKFMTSWFCGKRPSDIRILTSDSGFTSNQIRIEFLKHYIKNLNAGFDANWKLMFMNNHENHCIYEFV